ncbi:MAG TPA: macro domain-containing protein [Planctomycetota bacterium]|jgi:O-acetyl-ADP-ribose deacetylase (regulator of RNase III)|nr:macro domain-containing protein [Planctomycetota bacterium]
MEVEIVLGDLRALPVEGVVNPANSQGVMGGGVAGALRRAGGGEIEREARARAPIAVGEAVATTAGRLAYRFVVHAPTMERPAMGTSVEKVALAARAALRCAEEAGLRSLGVPGLGTGVGGVDPDAAAEAIVEAVGSFHGRRLEKVVLCDLVPEMVEAFRRAWEKRRA